MGTPIHVKQKKGAKTEAILQFLESAQVSQPAVIGAHTKLSAKEVSSRISMLAAQGRVAREGTGRRINIRFIGWDIVNSRVVEPERPPEVPMIDLLWNPVGNADQLRALAAAVAARKTVAADEDTDTVLGATATPFVQVLLKAQGEGRVSVRTHCIVDDEDYDEDDAALKAKTRRRTAAQRKAAAAQVPAEPGPEKAVIVRAKRKPKAKVTTAPVAVAEALPPVTVPAVAAEPVVMDPVVAELVMAEPAVMDAVVAEAVAVESVVPEAAAAEPAVMEAGVAEPVAAEPVVAEPARMVLALPVAPALARTSAEVDAAGGLDQIPVGMTLPLFGDPEGLEPSIRRHRRGRGRLRFNWPTPPLRSPGLAAPARL